MPTELNATHDPARRSWVESANADGIDFPIQNLPFGVFDDGKGARGGVALGDRIIDLTALLKRSLGAGRKPSSSASPQGGSASVTALPTQARASAKSQAAKKAPASKAAAGKTAKTASPKKSGRRTA